MNIYGGLDYSVTELYELMPESSQRVLEALRTYFTALEDEWKRLGHGKAATGVERERFADNFKSVFQLVGNMVLGYGTGHYPHLLHPIPQAQAQDGRWLVAELIVAAVNVYHSEYLSDEPQ